MQNIKIAVIPVAGRGNRLGELGKETPKCLLDLNGKPLLQYIVNNIRKAGVEKIYLKSIYQKEKFQEFASGKEIEFIDTIKKESELGNIWCDMNLEGDILFCVGDVINDVDIKDLYKFHLKNKSDFTIVSKKIQYKIPKGVMKISNKKLTEYMEKPNVNINMAIGTFIIKGELFKLVPNNKRYNIPDFINDMLKLDKRVFVYDYYGEFISIDTLQDYEEAQRRILTWHQD